MLPIIHPKWFKCTYCVIHHCIIIIVYAANNPPEVVKCIYYSVHHCVLIVSHIVANNLPKVVKCIY